MRLIQFLVLCSVWLLSAMVSAHQLSTAYIDLAFEEGLPKAEIKLPLEELSRSISLDADLNGQLTWGEVTQSEPVILAFIQRSILWQSTSQACSSQLTQPLQSQTIDGAGYLLVNMEVLCQQSHLTSMNYSAFFDHHSEHKALLNVTQNGTSFSQVISADEPVAQLVPAQYSAAASFIHYVIEGVWHIWIGFDHILFLLVLLVSVVLTQRNGRWMAEPSYRDILLKSVLIISSFTVAHSITLTLGVLDIIRFNTQWVEVGIAISIVLAALNNIWPLVTRVYLATFALGLIHGFGFASVLSNLSQTRITEVMTLAGFNIGVELGQIAIVLVVLPLFYLLSRRDWYSAMGVQSFSLIAGGMGTYWAITRIA